MIRQNRAWLSRTGRPPLAAWYQKNRFSLDEWDKEITPSTELRKAFHAKSSILQPFASNILQNWRNTARRKAAGGHRQKTAADPALLAKNTTQNHALVLADWLRSLYFSTASGGYFSPAGWSRRHNPIHQSFHRPVICNCC